jgi:hypothetical protein
MRLIGHSDQGGRGDGVQLMVNRGFAYVGHMFSKGFSVVDVRDPANPKTVNYIEAPFNTWNIHLQTHDDLLLVINAKDMFAATVFQDEKAYYTGAIGEKVGTASGPSKDQRDWTAGMSVGTSRTASHRLHAGRGRRHPPHLVHRRPLGVRLRSSRRIYRLYPCDRRHERPDKSPRGRPLLARWHEPGSRRNANLAF